MMVNRGRDLLQEQRGVSSTLDAEDDKEGARRNSSQVVSLKSELPLIFLYSPSLSLILPRNQWIAHYKCSGNC